MEEKIGEKIKRFANLPHVVENRRKLRAMYYIVNNTKDGKCSVRRNDINSTNILVVTLWLPIQNGACTESTPVEKLILYPMMTYL